jgi:hypothetical protein
MKMMADSKCYCHEVPKDLHGSEAAPPEKLDPGDDQPGTVDHYVEGFEGLLLTGREQRDSQELSEVEVHHHWRMVAACRYTLLVTSRYLENEPVKSPAEPMVCGLSAGGSEIRTSGSAREALSRFDLLRFISIRETVRRFAAASLVLNGRACRHALATAPTRTNRAG